MGDTLQSVKFDGEEFSRVSGFYKESNGNYQEKIAKVKIMSYIGND